MFRKEENSMSDFDFFKNVTDTTYKSKIFCQMDALSLYFLLSQNAVWVINEVDEYYRTGKFNEKLRKYMDMADHGYVNYLLGSVRLICSFIKTYKNDKGVKSFIQTEILAEALTKFKQYKDNERRKEIAELGENYGSALEYAI